MLFTGGLCRTGDPLLLSDCKRLREAKYKNKTNKKEKRVDEPKANDTLDALPLMQGRSRGHVGRFCAQLPQVNRLGSEM